MDLEEIKRWRVIEALGKREEHNVFKLMLFFTGLFGLLGYSQATEVRRLLFTISAAYQKPRETFRNNAARKKLGRAIIRLLKVTKRQDFCEKVKLSSNPVQFYKDLRFLTKICYALLFIISRWAVFRPEKSRKLLDQFLELVSKPCVWTKPSTWYCSPRCPWH